MDELATAGSLDESSPGYFVVPKTYAIPMEQRYLKVVYNSEETVRTVGQVSYDDILMTSSQCFGAGYVLTNPSDAPASAVGTVAVMFASKHGLSTGAKVRFDTTDTDTYPEFKNKEHLIGSATDITFTVTFVVDLTYHGIILKLSEFKAIFDEMQVSVVTESSAKIYHSGEQYTQGDTVVFDKLTNGQTFNILEVGQDGQNYFVIDETLPPGISKVVKSHVNDELGDVIDFMHVTHMQYYEVANVKYEDSRLWLSYDPDTSPKGRVGHKVSYVQFFHNEL